MTGVGAPEDATTQLPPQAPPAESGPEAPTRAFAGFRTDRRARGPERREPGPPPAPVHAPAPAAMPPWESTPVTGIARVDPTAFGAYYTGPVEAPPPAAPPYRLDPVPHTPYPELSTGMLLRPDRS